MKNVEPLKSELAETSASIEKIEGTRRKYMKLYEEEGIPTEFFVSRLEELKTDESRLSARRAEIEAELGTTGSESIFYDSVRGETLSRFNQVPGAAPPDQKKTLLQLISRRVHLTEDR